MRYADYRSIFKRYETEHLERGSRKLGERHDGRKWNLSPEPLEHERDQNRVAISAAAFRCAEARPMMAEALPSDLLLHCVSIPRRIAASTTADAILTSQWRVAFEGVWCVSAQNKRAKTTHNNRESTASMCEDIHLNVRDIAGSEFCISSNSGQKIYDSIKSAISQGKKVCLSFEGIKSLSAAFIDSAIGQLYNGEIKEDIDKNLSFENISRGRKLIIDEAVCEAKKYYDDPEWYIAKMKKILDDD